MMLMFFEGLAGREGVAARLDVAAELLQIEASALLRELERARNGRCDERTWFGLPRARGSGLGFEG